MTQLICLYLGERKSVLGENPRPEGKAHIHFNSSTFLEKLHVRGLGERVLKKKSVYFE